MLIGELQMGWQVTFVTFRQSQATSLMYITVVLN